MWQLLMAAAALPRSRFQMARQSQPKTFSAPDQPCEVSSGNSPSSSSSRALPSRMNENILMKIVTCDRTASQLAGPTNPIQDEYVEFLRLFRKLCLHYCKIKMAVVHEIEDGRGLIWGPCLCLLQPRDGCQAPKTCLLVMLLRQRVHGAPELS